MNKCNIVCGGVISDFEKTGARIDKGAPTICADGGYAHIEKLGLKAEVVLGDFDSFDKSQLREQDNVIVFPARKDFTDSEIAVQYAIEHGYTDLVLIGALGGRLDHALGNLHLLAYAHENGVRATIVDVNTQVWYETAGRQVQGKAGDILSIVPLNRQGRYTLRGLEYPLECAPLPLTGISNIFTGETAEVIAENAEFLLIHISK